MIGVADNLALAVDSIRAHKLRATLRYKNIELDDTIMYGYTPTMADIDTRTARLGRYFTEVEDRHDADSSRTMGRACSFRLVLLPWHRPDREAG